MQLSTTQLKRAEENPADFWRRYARGCDRRDRRQRREAEQKARFEGLSQPASDAGNESRGFEVPWFALVMLWLTAAAVAAFVDLARR